MTKWVDDSGWITRALGGLVLALWGAIDGAAAEPVYDRGAVLVFHEENDLFVNTDRHYTQGIRFAYLHEDGHMPLGFAGLNQWLPTWGFDLKSGRSGYSVGQNIYTPADLDSTALVPADRPYAGWLYLGAILQRNGVTRQRAVPVQESWELEMGVIGPTSLARQAQTWVHEIRGFDVPRGWRNQLRDEPGFRLKFERAYRYNVVPPDGVLGVEFLPWGGVALGTIEDSLRIGGMFRCGFLLPPDFGVRTIDSLSTPGGGSSKSARRRWGAYLFAGAEGRLVGRNAFLDGNLYRSSHDVGRRHFVGDFLFGAAMTVRPFEFGYVQIMRSPEFGDQTEHNEFGSIFVKILF